MAAEPSTSDVHVLRSTRISFAGARRVLDAAVARATELGTPVCVEIVDPSGEPVLAARMDGAALMSSRIAADKAYTVVAFNGRDTEVWVPGLASKPEVLEAVIVRTPALATPESEAARTAAVRILVDMGETSFSKSGLQEI